VALAFWPARVARRKGHSFLGYFIFSLIFFPLALITAYMVQDRTAAPAACSLEQFCQSRRTGRVMWGFRGSSEACSGMLLHAV
jgi:hypothetical protein